MINIRPSRIGLLPCIIILILWIVLPPPDIPISPALDPQTRQAALRALKASHLRQLRSRSSGASYYHAKGPSPPCRLHVFYLVHFPDPHARGLPKTTPPSAASAIQPPSGPHTIDDPSTSSSFSISSGRLAPCVTNKLAKQRKVLLVTAIQPSPCRGPEGDFLNSLSIQNKHDYAFIQNYDFFVSRRLTDVNLKGAWNKVALVRELLERMGQYEWIVWMDYDALVVDIAFGIPFEKYRGKDFVVWGQDGPLFEQGDAHMGVFYIRNTEWSRSFLLQIASYGTGNGKDREEEMKKSLGKYDWALFDQNGFTHVLKTWQPELSKSKTHLEREYYINGYWRDLPVENLEDVNPFVKHYMGCQFCSGINKVDGAHCKKDFEQTWDFVDRRVRKALNLTNQSEKN